MATVLAAPPACLLVQSGFGCFRLFGCPDPTGASQASRKLSTSLGEIASSVPSATEALPITAGPQIQLAIRSRAPMRLGLSTATPPRRSTNG